MRPGVWVLGIILLVGGVLVMIPRRSPPPMERNIPLEEVERSLLVLKEGRLERDGKVFTGYLTEHYPDGALKSKSVISNGQLNGVSEGWHTNRVLQVREHFEKGVSHGTRIRWDEQGRKVSEALIVEGKIEGVFRRWHDNGVLAEEATMKRGEPEGLSRAWYPSGCLKAEVTMANGKVTARHNYADGEKGISAEPENQQVRR